MGERGRGKRREEGREREEVGREGGRIFGCAHATNIYLMPSLFLQRDGMLTSCVY